MEPNSIYLYNAELLKLRVVVWIKFRVCNTLLIEYMEFNKQLPLSVNRNSRIQVRRIIRAHERLRLRGSCFASIVICPLHILFLRFASIGKIILSFSILLLIYRDRNNDKICLRRKSMRLERQTKKTEEDLLQGPPCLWRANR
ncbi:unnamed protein product [Musa acuminata subsp. malaccensis]|uniref:(wild Malaysian banana) hypothetical protein n=1 Tax=Musa acuminata subsp. malaccensis TaxID=214687 RepID=A0A804IZM8_MUSAM|nr:unnamed protein product [Musa acuminata subsp. malaccensis]